MTVLPEYGLGSGDSSPGNWKRSYGVGTRGCRQIAPSRHSGESRNLLLVASKSLLDSKGLDSGSKPAQYPI